jgi:hypothetical protein
MSDVVNPEEFGLEKPQSQELLGNLSAIKAEREILVNQYNQVIHLDVEDPASAKIAKELRLRIRDNRTKGIDVWHKNTKDYFLKAGQFLDAVKRKENEYNTHMEKNLEEIEKYQERKEAERKQNLREQRMQKVGEYADFLFPGIDLGELSEDDFQRAYSSAKTQYEADLQEKEEERLRQEQEQKRNEVITNNRNILLPYQFFLENFNQIDFENADILGLLKEAKKKKKENDALVEKGNALRKELEEKRAQEVLEEQKRKEKQEEVERLQKAPVKEQLKAWVDSFEIPEPAIKINSSNFDSELENDVWVKPIYDIEAKFESFKKWALSEIEKV